MRHEKRKSIIGFQRSPFITALMGALLLGFAWQIRGSGTSDPSVVAVLFLMYFSVNYSPRKKFNMLVFGLAALMFNVMRTGWGTFIPQAGLPGIIPGYLPPNIDIAVPWWYGYFWLFVVGISWMGLPSLLFGGYLFTRKHYGLKDVVIIIIIFVSTRYLLTFLLEPLIPFMASEYYNEIYLTGISERSYGSMIGNLSTALAIIPVLLYILYVKKDKYFFKYSLAAMLIFALSLSLAVVWRPVSVLTGLAKYGGWSMWEYTTGFLFGLGIFLYYARIQEKELRETDQPLELNYSRWNPLLRFLLFAFAFYRLVLHGIGESLEGAIRKSMVALGYEHYPSGETLMLVTVIGGLLLYWFYYNGKIGVGFARKSFKEKSIIALMLLLPLHYLFFATHYFLEGTLFDFNNQNIAVLMDSFSFVVVEIYIIYLYRKLGSFKVEEV